MIKYFGQLSQLENTESFSDDELIHWLGLFEYTWNLSMKMSENIFFHIFIWHKFLLKINL